MPTVPPPQIPRTSIVAHRGGAALWPENSLTAVRGALALGVDGIEIDVHQSADGELVVIHDATLKRTLAAAGEVGKMTYRDIRAAAEAADGQQKAPLLGEVCALIAKAKVAISVELKTSTDGQRYAGLAAATLGELQAHGLSTRAFLHAFDWAYLEEVQALAPALALGANVDRKRLAAFPSWTALLEALLKLGVRDLNADHRLLDAEVIAAAHARGLGVTLWTVNEEAAITRFLQAGADHLCSDFPDRALHLRKLNEDKERSKASSSSA